MEEKEEEGPNLSGQWDWNEWWNGRRRRRSEPANMVRSDWEWEPVTGITLEKC